MKQLRELVDRKIKEIEYPERPAGLYAPIRYALEAGGKRVRPVLMLAVVRALGGAPETYINQALGLEMFHNFTLLHDDLMDRADVRHGKPTVHRKWNDATAILSGDAMLTMAGQLMGRTPDGVNASDVVDEFNEVAMEVYEGQQLDMEFEQRTDVTLDEYIEMIGAKTAALIAGATSIGAILMRPDDDAVFAAFYEYGRCLGLAFQLQDDWLDTYGDPDTFGKAIGGDILNDKKTFLLIHALNSADSVQRGELLGLMGTRSDDKIARVKAIYDACGSGDACRRLTDRYVNQAIECINDMGVDGESAELFRQITEKLRARRS